MKLISAMLVVKDINQSVDFYETVLGLKIISDFGANKTLSGGLALQTLDSYKQFIETAEIIRKYTSRSTISTSLPRKSKNSKSSMFILSKNTAGDSG